jgi:transposase
VDQLLFFDESGFASDEANRPCGWGSQPRVIEVDNYTRAETLQLLALVGLNGVCAFSINEGTTNQFRVAEFFAFKLSKIPQNSVVVMDNASFHHEWVEDVLRNLFSTKNIQLLFLPPYSPDLSPAENFFGMVKFFIKDNRTLYRENRVLTICSAINLLEPRHFVAFFQTMQIFVIYFFHAVIQFFSINTAMKIRFLKQCHRKKFKHKSTISKCNP